MSENIKEKYYEGWNKGKDINPDDLVVILRQDKDKGSNN